MGDRAHLSLVAALALLATVVMIGTIGAGRATAAADRPAALEVW